MTAQLFPAARESRPTDERYTPQWIFDGLGLSFDMDPCSPVAGGDCVPAARKLTVRDDGLVQPWHGLVWCNPPFSNATPWADRFMDHGAGVWLGPIANARWSIELAGRADLVWWARDFPFTHPTHAGKRSSMPIMFAALGDQAAAGLGRLARSGLHTGVLLKGQE